MAVGGVEWATTVACALGKCIKKITVSNELPTFGTEGWRASARAFTFVRAPLQTYHFLYEFGDICNCSHIAGCAYTSATRARVAAVHTQLCAACRFVPVSR